MIIRKVMIATLATCLITGQQAEARVKPQKKGVAPAVTSATAPIETKVSNWEKANKIADYASYGIVAAGLIALGYAAYCLQNQVTIVNGKCEVSDHGKFAYTVLKALGMRYGDGDFENLKALYTYQCRSMLKTSDLLGKSYLRIGQ